MSGYFYDLHSNMERFKAAARHWRPVSRLDLHSNMERFKEVMSRQKLTYVQIYIPIWRDLKQVKFLPKLHIIHLHSNMERFKAATITAVSPISHAFTFQYGEI